MVLPADRSGSRRRPLTAPSIDAATALKDVSEVDVIAVMVEVMMRPKTQVASESVEKALIKG